MNILHVVNIYFVLPYFIGGQFDYFHQKGYHLHVVCSPSPYLDDYAKAHHFRYITLPILRQFAIVQDLKTLYHICRYIRQNHIDIVVGHTPKGALLGMLAAWLCRVPKRFYFRHGLVYETSRGLVRRLLILLDRISSFCATEVVCVSPSVLERSLQDHLTPAHKQRILNHGTCNGIDTQGKFNPQHIQPHLLQSLRQQYHIEPVDYVVGYTGRLVRDKGICQLVEAFSLLPIPNKKLLLVGMFEERDALPEEVRQRILNDPDIIYTGFVNKDIEYYYALMSVYALISYREGFPTGVLEAQSMTIPVVTTRVTGCCDSIQDGITGCFTDHQPSHISEAILHLRQIPKAGLQGREWVINNYDNHLIWQAIEQMYQL